tara:strand:+ start:198 stop:389 length:192 start_codon:yes stop_codon:yes gene_type:complete
MRSSFGAIAQLTGVAYDSATGVDLVWLHDNFGAIAQLGERNTGSVEVGGSIPPGSTNYTFELR